MTGEAKLENAIPLFAEAEVLLTVYFARAETHLCLRRICCLFSW
jgi:hypothetical protein